MRANTSARSEQLESLLSIAKQELARVQAVFQRQHLLFSLIETAAGADGSCDQPYLLGQIGAEITNEARLNLEAAFELIDGGVRHG